MLKYKQSKQAQIRRKLTQSGISKPEQYEEIIANLMIQRERLESDVNALREKVIALQERQAQKQITRGLKKRSSTNKNPVNYREELEKKYQELRLWQKRSMKAMKHSNLELQYRTFLDKLFCVDKEIQTQMRQLNDQMIVNKRLMKAWKALTKDERKANNVKDSIEDENGMLKRKIFSLKKITEEHLSKEIGLQNHLIDIKEKMRQNKTRDREVLSRNRRSSKDSRTLRDVARIKTEDNRVSQMESHSSQSEEIIDFEVSPTQITSEDEVFQVQGRLNRLQKKWKGQVSDIQEKIYKRYTAEVLNQKRQESQLTYMKQFQILFEKVKANLAALNEQHRSKIQLLLSVVSKNQTKTFTTEKRSESSLLKKSSIGNDFYKKHPTEVQIASKEVSSSSLSNFYKIKSEIINNDKVDKKENDKMICFDAGTITDSVEQLRQQYVGNIEENCFYDRSILGKETNNCIKALHIYYTDRGIATIKAIYHIPANDSTKSSKIILPQGFIKDYCKLYTIEANPDDFIRYLKVRYHFLQNRITNIKIITNRNMKNGWGDAKIKKQQPFERDQQNDRDFVFDINQDEYPVSIICSHVQKGPYWYLCGFGVQINDL